ncbi:MAG TPA: pitrilysin family protein [Gemmatimonadales bacterium]|jgi:zinc protease
MTLPGFSSWTSGVRKEVLDNGLTLLVQRDRSASVAAVVTHVKAGFFDEPDRWVGISHVLEHMFFKGTPTRGPGQIARETKTSGGYLNASTSYDHTSYFVVLPAGRLAEAIAIQADALMHAALDAGELGRELQVIIQEAKRKLDTPGAVVHETLHEVMYDHHRIRRWRIGYERDLAGFTRDDVDGYYRSRYVPSRTIVAIVGDVDEDEALSLGRHAYAGWASGEAATDRSPAEPPLRQVRARTLRGDVTQAELALGWKGVPALDPLAIPLDLGAAVLGLGRGSWLYQALRESGLATAVSAHHYTPTELGVYAIGAECHAERVGTVVEKVAAATTRLTMAGPDAADLERARTLLQSRWARRLEEMDGRAAALAGAEALGDYRLVDQDFSRLAAATADDVRDAARRVLDPEAVAAVVYLPRKQGEDLTVERLARVFAVTELDGSAVRRLGGLRAEPKLRPYPSPPPSRRVAEVHHVALPGFDLLVRRKPGVPLVSLGVYLPRTTFDPEGLAGVSALAVRSAIRGAGELSAAELAFAFERLGGTLGSSITLDWLGFGTSVLASRLGEAAGLLDLVLSHPRYDEAQVVAERGLLVEETARVADDMFRYPFQLAFEVGFGGRAYGVPALGLPDQLRTVSVEQVRRWHREALLGPRGVIIAVGDLDPEDALGELANRFGGNPARIETGGLRDPIAWALHGETVSRVVPREKTQSAFAMAFPGPSRRDPRRHATDVWSAVASGLGGRLFEALRDRRSLAYTVVVSSWQRARSGALLAYIATSPEREDEARCEMLRELMRFAEQPVSPTELAQATGYLAGQTEVNRQSGAAVSLEVLDAWLAGEGLGDLEDPAGRYRSVTADEVRDVAAEILRPAQVRAEGVVRGTGGGK